MVEPMMVETAGPVAYPYDCRGFKADAFAAAIRAQRTDQFSTVLDTVFLHAPDAAGSPLLAAAYSTGIISACERRLRETPVPIHLFSDGKKFLGSYGTEFTVAWPGPSASWKIIHLLYKLRDCISQWLSQQQLGRPCLSWQGHKGAATCLQALQQDAESLLLSGGRDGVIRTWNVASLLAAADTWQAEWVARQKQADQQAAPFFHPSPAQLQPAHSVTLLPPGGAGAWDIPASASAGVSCMAVDQQSDIIFAGASDGRCHVLPLSPHSTQPAAVAGAHLASVLSVDITPGGAAGGPRVATGSEDGTVRLWDLTNKTCTAVLRVGAAADAVGAAGADPAASGGAQLLPGNTPNTALVSGVPTAAPVTAVRFGGVGGVGSGASWLLCGLGGPSPALVTWSLDAGLVAQRTPLDCSPQFMCLVPGQVLVAGNSAHLFRYTFSGELVTSHPLPAPVQSALAMDVLTSTDPTPSAATANTAGRQASIAPGAVVVGGTGGALCVLSHYSTLLMNTHLQEDIVDLLTQEQ